jgi:hypothetical protein
MDKVKAQATDLATKAQTAAQSGVQQGQTKLAEMQAGKQSEHLLRELGAYVFLSERGRNQPDSEAKVAALMAELDQLEANGTPVTLAPDPTQLPSADAVPGAGTIPADGSVPQAAPIPQAAPPQAAPIPQAAPVPQPTQAPAPPAAGGGLPQAGGGLPGQ